MSPTTEQSPLIYLKLLWELSPYGNEWMKLKEWIFTEKYNRWKEWQETVVARQAHLYLLANGFI